MIKKFLSFSLILALLATMLPAAAVSAASETNVIYVAPYGKDSNNGSIDAPLATLEAAKKQVRNLKKKGIKGIEVVFREGDYHITKTVEFLSADSGKADDPIVYRSYEGEKATLKGSKVLNPSAFKLVEDSETLAMMHEKAIGNLYEVDLTTQGINMDELVTMPKNASPTLNKMDFNREFNWLFVDDGMQNVSRFPNGNDFARFYNGTANSFEYEDNVADKWVNHDDWWVYTYSSYDYNATRQSGISVDPDTNTIKTGNVSPSYSNVWSRAWCAYNLIEEIDVPGEYYINYNTGKLYYWPIKDIANSKIELSVIGNPVIKGNGLKNVTFRNLGFAQINDDGVQFFDSDNVDIMDCDFSGIGWRGLCYNGKKAPITKQYPNEFYQGYVRSPEVYDAKDASYNCDVKSNTFYNIGAHAIQMFGGNIDTLEPSNNVIEDNYIQKNAIVTTWDAIATHGVGNLVQHNNISDGKYHAVRSFGNDSIVRNNEIYNMLKEADDAGTIYISGGTMARGHKVEYNYIHDNEVRRPTHNGWQHGIYFDDGQQGNTASHNIIVGATQAALMSNQSMATTWVGNTAIGCGLGLRLVTAAANDKYYITSDYASGTVEGVKSKIHNPKLYYKHYPLLKHYVNTHINPGVYSVAKDNVMIDTKGNNPGGISHENTFYKKYSNAIKNFYDLEGDYSQFVDPENHDWRLKADSAAAAANPEALNENNFDMDLIGMKSEMVFNKETSPFAQLYPFDGQEGLSKNDLWLEWEDAFGAGRYDVIVATDEKLENVVYKSAVYYSAVLVEGLENGKTYYWKVTATNESREFGNTWESTSPVFSFTIKSEEDLDLVEAMSVAKRGRQMINTMVEGDEVGMYTPGTKANIEKLVAQLEGYVNSADTYGDTSKAQALIDASTKAISAELDSAGKVNKGYLDVSGYFKPEYWNRDEFIVSTDGVEYPGGTGNIAGGTEGLERTGGSVIWCFDAKINAGTGTDYFCMGLNRNSGTPNPVASNVGYYICFINGTIEVQNTDGAKQNVLEAKPFIIADGEYHSFEIGVLDVGAGNYVIVKIDGETIFEFVDTKTTAQNLPSQLTINAANSKSTFSIRKYSKDFPAQEEFDEVMKRASQMTAKEINAKFDDYCTNAHILRDGAAGVITKSGHRALTSAPVEYDGKLVVTKEVLAELLGNVTAIPVTTIDGTKMYDIATAAASQGKSCTYAPSSKILIIDDTGVVQHMNVPTYMNSVVEFFENYYK